MIARLADQTDVASICALGAKHIPDHYAPLIGLEAGQRQVDNWWTDVRIGSAVDDGRLILVEDAGCVIGVAEWSMYNGTPVVWRLAAMTVVWRDLHLT